MHVDFEKIIKIWDIMSKILENKRKWEHITSSLINIVK